MTLKRATEADRDAIRAHLMRHIAGSMFPLSNLDQDGIDGTALRGLRVWLGQGGLVAVTNEGMIMPQWPETPDWTAFAGVCPSPVIGAVGSAAQVRACLSALGLAHAPMQIDADEPHFVLPLAALRVPDAQRAHLAPVGERDRALTTRWRSLYHQEVLGTPANEADERAAQDIEMYIAKDSHRILWRNGEPLSMTGFNAQAADAVQIGGVFTPIELRGRGYARLAVALHLAEAQHNGTTTTAILFAAGPAAVRAYTAIGFRQIGTYALVIFDGPQEVRHG